MPGRLQLGQADAEKWWWPGRGTETGCIGLDDPPCLVSGTCIVWRGSGVVALRQAGPLPWEAEREGVDAWAGLPWVSHTPLVAVLCLLRMRCLQSPGAGTAGWVPGGAGAMLPWASPRPDPVVVNFDEHPGSSGIQLGFEPTHGPGIWREKGQHGA